jgi:beta-phosphoglucomutase
MTPEEILPGVREFLQELKSINIRIALGSASRNTPLILERVGLKNMFDAIADGNNVTKAKPDPEVFLKAAELIGVDPENCVVFEDAAAGVQAALNAGMKCVGIGSPEILSEAHMIVKGLHEMNAGKLFLMGKMF